MTGTINDSDNAMETGSRVRIKRDGQMPVSKLPPVPSHLFGDGVGKVVPSATPPGNSR